jgi:hypothetical protein
MPRHDLDALESTSRLVLHHFVFPSALEMAEPAPMMHVVWHPRPTGSGNLAERPSADRLRIAKVALSRADATWQGWERCVQPVWQVAGLDHSGRSKVPKLNGPADDH